MPPNPHGGHCRALRTCSPQVYLLTGTNAIVAVISYTGYDMEDAFILNKGSYERGFAHGSIYKSHVGQPPLMAP